MFKKLRIAWLAPYRISLLQPELRLERRPKLEHAASWIVNLAEALAKRDDVDLHIITVSSGIRETQILIKDGVTFHVIRHAIPYTVRGYPNYMRLDLLTGYRPLRRRITHALKSVRPDLIHVHGTEFGYGLAALDTKIPTIVSMQGIITLCAAASPSTAYRLQGRFERRIIRNVKYVGSRTEWANKFVRSVNSTATIYDFPEAVGEVFFRVSRGSSAQDILMVGTVARRKGVEEAMQAMRIVISRCPSARLLLVGEAQAGYVSELRAQMKSLGIEANVEWVGFRNSQEIAALHASAVGLIQPSHIDNSPNSVAEAMVSGVPVIASKAGGIPSIIEDGVTGILVEPRNSVQLAGAIIRLLSNDRERSRLADRAKAVARERHFPATVAKRAVQIYRDILSKKARSYPAS
jgi:glycosyltransferase involved in cell wall biosynthesis